MKNKEEALKLFEERFLMYSKWLKGKDQDVKRGAKYFAKYTYELLMEEDEDSFKYLGKTYRRCELKDGCTNDSQYDYYKVIREGKLSVKLEDIQRPHYRLENVLIKEELIPEFEEVENGFNN